MSHEDIEPGQLCACGCDVEVVWRTPAGAVVREARSSTNDSRTRVVVAVCLSACVTRSSRIPRRGCYCCLHSELSDNMLDSLASDFLNGTPNMQRVRAFVMDLRCLCAANPSVKLYSGGRPRGFFNIVIKYLVGG